MDWSLLGFQGLRQVFNIHPVFVHFPIALFPTALLFYFLGLILKKEWLFRAGQACLILGFVSTIPTVITGYFAQETFEHDEVTHQMMEIHEQIGFVILALGAILTSWSFVRREGRPRGFKVFLLVFFATFLVIAQNADLGGRMVFVRGAGVKAAQPGQIPTAGSSETKEGTSPEGDHHHHHH